MLDLNALPLPDLYREFASTGLVSRLLDLARDEDLGSGPGSGDITAQVSVPADARARAAIVARAPGTIAGLAALPDLIRAFNLDLSLDLLASDGGRASAGAHLAILSGPKRSLLSLERTALNLIGRLSGVATRTAEFAAALAAAGPARARLYDTRKTTPGLRLLEKYAVRCGGGLCHRIGLHDAVLIKDNHLAGVPLDRLAHTVEHAARAARAARPLRFVEVEVESIAQLDRLLPLQPGLIDVILLDNMSLDALARAVALRDASSARPALEASGGVRLETLAPIARTGVDRISAGALTHGSVWLDVAMDMLPQGE
jgi:nicotinate-nucleotide pyrophosphorylase (carboxylating)